MDKDFAFFKDLLLKHSVQRPPFSEKLRIQVKSQMQIALKVADTSKPYSSRQEIAMNELRNFVLSTLTPKLEELKAALLVKIAAQEDNITQRLKKLEEDEKALLGVSQADKGKKDKIAKKK
ncbi:hypothetical protein HDU96_005279 [Phlyctochytrium bullatum]|nr:hypothetical protein HDU96_005279 [Phlyctochytrium bullatum]